MTPLAQKMFTYMLKYKTNNIAISIDDMEQAACFDLTKVSEEIEILASDIFKDKSPLSDEYVFLPADITWIEALDESGERYAAFIKKMPDGFINSIKNRHSFYSSVYGEDVPLGALNTSPFIQGSMPKNCASAFVAMVVSEKSFSPCGFLALNGQANLHECFIRAPYKERKDINFIMHQSDCLCALVIASLALINSPKIIGRKTHLPHAGLQRKLARAKGIVGKYPLHAWTELLLEVTPPKDESGLIEQETTLTGERALHFVRAHLRIVGGKLVRVSAHWRGNAALGIKRTRYSVVPPKNGVWPKFVGGEA